MVRKKSPNISTQKRQKRKTIPNHIAFNWSERKREKVVIEYLCMHLIIFLIGFSLPGCVFLHMVFIKKYVENIDSCNSVRRTSFVWQQRDHTPWFMAIISIRIVFFLWVLYFFCVWSVDNIGNKSTWAHYLSWGLILSPPYGRCVRSWNVRMAARANDQFESATTLSHFFLSLCILICPSSSSTFF